ncbi:IstB-like ATP binding protein [Rhizobium sp. WW_1]|nr:IstB-like ATP binding protein [Rhizobium sp. WW_1]
MQLRGAHAIIVGRNNGEAHRFAADQRNVVLAGGTGTGKSHLAIAIARALIRNGTRGRFFNVVDLVNRLETETRNGKQGRMADYLTRLDFIILDELGYLPFAQAGASRAASGFSVDEAQGENGKDQRSRTDLLPIEIQIGQQ